MFRNDFLDNFTQLGERLFSWLNGSAKEPVLDNAMALASSDNPFFTTFMQRRAMETIAHTFLKREEMEQWLENYTVIKREAGSGCDEKYIGVIMAGNIPLVGFHDLFCVLACGANAVVKLSSKDNKLLPALVQKLIEINPCWDERIIFVENIGRWIEEYPNKIAAIIATGSDITRGEIAKQFKGTPMLLRGRRFSFAVLSGKESDKELGRLAEDVLLYFGLGCRSINYLLVPRGYDFKKLIAVFSELKALVDCDCYRNNYKRARAMLTLEGKMVVDGGFYILLQTPDVYPPVAVTGYAEYDSEEDILAFENANKEHIQKKYRTFGLAQTPAINEYADEIDTMKFIFSQTHRCNKQI